MMKNFLQRTVWTVLGTLTVTAHAQSDVTVSGYLDAGIYRDTSKTSQLGPIQRSNIKFSGNEDLGGGLSVTFALSHRFDTGTGAVEDDGKPYFHGESTVGLKGAFGSIQLGRRLDAVWSYDYSFDPWENFDRIASPAWDLWHYNFPSDPKGNNGKPEYGRLNNGIFYDSPSFGGFTVHISGSPETSDGDANKPLAAAVQYNNDVLTALVAHGKNSAGNTDSFAGLRVNLSSVAIMGAYNVSKAVASNPTPSSKAKSITLGATYTLDLLTLKAGWGQVDVDDVKAQKMVGLGASYSLSKRTRVYVDWARKKYPNKSASTYGGGIAHSF